MGIMLVKKVIVVLMFLRGFLPKSANFPQRKKIRRFARSVASFLSGCLCRGRICYGLLHNTETMFAYTKLKSRGWGPVRCKLFFFQLSVCFWSVLALTFEKNSLVNATTEWKLTT